MTTLTADVRSPFREPRTWIWVLVAVAGRFPFTAAFTVLVLATSRLDTASVGVQLAGVFSVAFGAFGPLWGRWLCRAGPVKMMRIANFAGALVLVSMAVAFAAGLPLWGMFVLAGLHGAVQAPQGTGYRAIVPALAAARHRHRVSALDVVIVEVALMLGPLFVVALGRVTSAELILCLLAAVALLSALLLLVVPEVPASSASTARIGFSVEMLTLLVTAATVGFVSGILEAAGALRVIDVLGSAALVGFVSLLLSSGAMTGGAASIVLPTGKPERTSRPIVLLVLGIGALCLVLAGLGPLWIAGVALFVGGLLLGRVHAQINVLVLRRFAADAQAQPLGWYTGVIILGAGLGRYASGWAAPGLSFLIAAAISLAGAASICSLRGNRRRGQNRHAVDTQ